MKYLLLLIFLVGCKENNQDLKCMDGYLVSDIENNFHAFCKEAYRSGESIVGKSCYDLPYSSPRARAEVVLLKSGTYFKTKCYNADRDN